MERKYPYENRVLNIDAQTYPESAFCRECHAEKYHFDKNDAIRPGGSLRLMFVILLLTGK